MTRSELRSAPPDRLPPSRVIALELVQGSKDHRHRQIFQLLAAHFPLQQIRPRCRWQTKTDVGRRLSDVGRQTEMIGDNVGEIIDGAVAAEFGRIMNGGDGRFSLQTLDQEPALIDIFEVHMRNRSYQPLKGFRLFGSFGLQPTQPPPFPLQQLPQKIGDVREIIIDQRLADTRLPTDAVHRQRRNAVAGDDLCGVIEDQRLPFLRRQTNALSRCFGRSFKSISHFDVPRSNRSRKYAGARI